MKKFFAGLLAIVLVLQGCAPLAGTSSSESSGNESEAESTSQSEADAQGNSQVEAASFTDLSDPDLLPYIEDSVYSDLVSKLDSDDYFVENVEAKYVSQEYLDELAYNSQENIYFGYSLADLEEQFQGQKYIFTLGDDGKTTVQAFENYDDTYDQIVRNVAVGTGVILVCVTVSVVSGGTAPAVSMVFACSAKAATVASVSGGLISGVMAGAITGVETQDFDESLKAAELSASDGYMWGAITGAIGGGVGELAGLEGATTNGLKINQAAQIQRECKWDLNTIKELHSWDEYQIYKGAGLTDKTINLGKAVNIENVSEPISKMRTLMPDIDWGYTDEASGMTNLQRALKGLAPLDPESGKAYEIHHIGQRWNSFAVLTREQHIGSGNYEILHYADETDVLDHGTSWGNLRSEFWKAVGAMVESGAI